MANMERSFQAGDHTYTIRFSQNALYKLEKEIGQPLALIKLHVGPVVLQTMLWAGLEGERIKNDPRRKPFTIEQAGEIIDEMGGLGKATPIILDAWQAALVRVEKTEASEKSGEENKPANPTKA